LPYEEGTGLLGVVGQAALLLVCGGAGSGVCCLVVGDEVVADVVGGAICFMVLAFYRV